MPKISKKSTLQNGFDFVEKAKETSLEEAKKLLSKHGYSILDPLDSGDYKPSIPSLVSFFYKKLRNAHSNREMVISSTSSDRQYASMLVRWRKDTGVTTQRAYEEARRIINILFEQEPLLKLSEPIMSMRVLSIEWVYKKLVYLYNKEQDIDDALCFSQYETESSKVLLEDKDLIKQSDDELNKLYDRLVLNKR